MTGFQSMMGRTRMVVELAPTVEMEWEPSRQSGAQAITCILSLCQIGSTRDRDSTYSGQPSGQVSEHNSSLITWFSPEHFYIVIVVRYVALCLCMWSVYIAKASVFTPLHGPWTSSDHEIWLFSFSTSSIAEECGKQQFLRPVGIITSPQYPLNYRPNEHCVYKIRVKANHDLVIKTEEMNMPAKADCTEGDSILISSEVGKKITHLTRLCGQRQLAPYTVRRSNSVKYVRLEFTSDYKREGKFLLRYERIPVLWNYISCWFFIPPSSCSSNVLISVVYILPYTALIPLLCTVMCDTCMIHLSGGKQKKL